jgi:hypothetical protein
MMAYVITAPGAFVNKLGGLASRRVVQPLPAEPVIPDLEICRLLLSSVSSLTNISQATGLPFPGGCQPNCLTWEDRADQLGISHDESTTDKDMYNAL